MRLENQMANTHPDITSDPAIAFGKPVVRGTRITVEHVLDRLGGGDTIESLCDAHPRLTAEGVRAALRYAADVLRADVVLPFGGSSE